MNPIAYRVVRAPLRSLAFLVLGLAALMNSSDAVGAVLGKRVAGVFAFVMLLAFGACAAYGAWFAREHSLAEAPLLHRLGAAHLSFVVILVVCVLAPFGGSGGLASAIGLALASLSLWRIREESIDGPRDRTPLLRDSDVARAH
ncbi:hypothetical protein [Cumulibacter manganitolerans]|uniref:hypothetical protein n=1 Tax=Cumulibacter manganitolerans TaxID=1884992 RepID=UPI001E574365|nr:hypothetical protein [Cumulibacter manganitolerans]